LPLSLPEGQERGAGNSPARVHASTVSTPSPGSLSTQLFLTPSVSTGSGTSSDWEALDSDIAEIAAEAEKTKGTAGPFEGEDEDDDEDEEKDSDDDLPEDSQRKQMQKNTEEMKVTLRTWNSFGLVHQRSSA
jgi:hypothetical protein